MSSTLFAVARYEHIVQHAVSPLFAPPKGRASSVTLVSVTGDAIRRKGYAKGAFRKSSIGKLYAKYNALRLPRGNQGVAASGEKRKCVELTISWLKLAPGKKGSASGSRSNIG